MTQRTVTATLRVDTSHVERRMRLVIDILRIFHELETLEEMFKRLNEAVADFEHEIEAGKDAESGSDE